MVPIDIESLKHRMAAYILALAQEVRGEYGPEALTKFLCRMAFKSADEKASQLKSVAQDQRPLTIARRFCKMLSDFGAADARVVLSGANTRTVTNEVCPCLHTFVNQAASFGFTHTEVRKCSCKVCFPAYAEGARLSGMAFNGELTDTGCWMSFSAGPVPLTINGKATG